jgi:hypothetical protein
MVEEKQEFLKKVDLIALELGIKFDVKSKILDWLEESVYYPTLDDINFELEVKKRCIQCNHTLPMTKDYFKDYIKFYNKFRNI